MARCKFGRLASPVRTAAGGMRRCRKRPKAGGSRRRRKARGRKCKIYGIVRTSRGTRPACASYKRTAATFNPRKQLKSRNWVGMFTPASEYRKMRRASAKKASRKGSGVWEERSTPGRQYYRG